MSVRRSLTLLSVLWLGCAAYAESKADPRALLPPRAKLISQHEVELDGASPRESALLYRYTKDGEDREVLAFYQKSCGLYWASEEALSTTIAPTWEAKDLTGDGLNELLVYQSVHADQEFSVHVYQQSGCALKEVLSDFTRPGVPPKLQTKDGATTLTFWYAGNEGCEGSEDPGFVHTYSVTKKGFTLIEDRPALRLYPLFTPTLSGKSLAEEAASSLGRLTLFDHLAADLDGDGRDEAVLLYNQDDAGALQVATRSKKGGFKSLLQASMGAGLLALDGPVKAISAYDLTGDGVKELIVDSSANAGCQLDTWVIRFSKGEPQLLLQVRRSFKEEVSLSSSKLSYRDTEKAMPSTWTWSGASFVGPAGEVFSPKTLR